MKTNRFHCIEVECTKISDDLLQRTKGLFGGSLSNNCQYYCYCFSLKILDCLTRQPFDFRILLFYIICKKHLNTVPFKRIDTLEPRLSLDSCSLFIFNIHTKSTYK